MVHNITSGPTATQVVDEQGPEIVSRRFLSFVASVFITLSGSSSERTNTQLCVLKYHELNVTSSGSQC